MGSFRKIGYPPTTCKRSCNTCTTFSRTPKFVTCLVIFEFLLIPLMKANDSVDELATLKFWTDQESANKEIKKYVSNLTCFQNR